MANAIEDDERSRPSHYNWRGHRARIVAQFDAHGASLTPFREAVLDQLVGSLRPLGAYDIAERLSGKFGKPVAPNSVYRVLDVLIECEVVRRVESKQAYCLAAPDLGAGSILLMCEACGVVEAIDATAIDQALDRQTRAAHFRAVRKVIEVTGLCQCCDSDNKSSA